MGFDKNVREDALVASARCCCICHEFKGIKVEVHHIIPREQGGTDDYGNAIPLCFDCHADAGHYHAKHPKGSKYAPSELRKHRDVWFKIVAEGKTVSNQLSSENIICQYIITNDIKSVEDIRNSNIKIGYFSNILYYQPEILKEDIEYFLSGEGYKFVEGITFENEEEYLLKNPDAKRIEDDVSYYQYERPFSDNELKKVDNFIYKALRQNGYDINLIAQRRGYYDCCGGTFVETVEVADLYMCFLSVYNVAESFIQLDELEISTLYGEDKIKFPKVMVQPKATVLMPISIIAEPLNRIIYKKLSSETNMLSPYEVQEFNRVSLITSESSKKSILPIGNTIDPYAIKYFKDCKAYYNNIHSFDFNNMYKIDRHFQVGSCPHVFYIDVQGNLKYISEIFCKAYGLCSMESVTIPYDADKIIIAELEYETTFIKSVYADKDKIFCQLVLNKDEFIEVNVTGKSLLLVEGYYLSAINPEKYQQKIDKNKIVKIFEFNYRNHNPKNYTRLAKQTIQYNSISVDCSTIQENIGNEG